MKIAIAGALGHIGSKLIRVLPGALDGAEVRMIDNMMTQRYCSLFDLPGEGTYRFYEGDVLELELEEIFAGCDAVIQLAAITDAAGSFANKEKVEQNNYYTTERIAKACRKTGAAMIHLSSTSVYGTQSDVVDEACGRNELKPQSPYAETKLREEELLAELAAKGEFRFITCRFGTIAGTSPGMRFHTAVNKFCWQAVLGQPLTVWKTALHQKRPYLDLDDAARAIAFIIQNEIFDNRVYNVLTDNLTVHDIVEFIRKRVSDLSINFVETEIMNQLSYHVANDRFCSKGFAFEGSIEKCVEDTLALLAGANGV